MRMYGLAIPNEFLDSVIEQFGEYAKQVYDEQAADMTDEERMVTSAVILQMVAGRCLLKTTNALEEEHRADVASILQEAHTAGTRTVECLCVTCTAEREGNPIPENSTIH